ncbi:putative sugar transporter, partial [Aureobasidium melanogenum]
LVGVEHVRRQEDARDFDDVVGSTTDTGGKRAETNGRGFTDDDPGCRSGTKGEEHGNNQTKRGLSKVGSVDRSSAIEGGQDPGQHNKNHLESGSDETESEGEIVADTGLLEEVNGLISNQVTSQVLSGVDEANDEGTAEVGALENLLVLALTSQPPGRLRGEPDEDGEGSREHPLESNWDPVGPWLVDWVVYISDGADDDTADSPEHLQHLSCGSSKSQGNDLGTVSRSVGNEDTPWNTLEDLSCKDDGHGVCEVEDEDEGIEKHETSQGCIAVTDAGGQGTGDEDTNEGAELTRNLESGLPLCCDDLFCGVVVGRHSESFFEGRKGHEVTDEEDVVGFHDLAGRVS